MHVLIYFFPLKTQGVLFLTKPKVCNLFFKKKKPNKPDNEAQNRLFKKKKKEQKALRGLAKLHSSEESEKIGELSTNVVYKLFAFMSLYKNLKTYNSDLFSSSYFHEETESDS